jgi:hypothetical protein
MMLNDTFVLEQSLRLAERLGREYPGKLRSQVERAWRLVYGVAPTEAEQLQSLVYLAEQGEAIRARNAALARPQADRKADAQVQALASLCQALLGANRFLYVD